MAEVLLFHHAQGRTPGVRAFAKEFRAGGHTVHTPDLFDGRTFQSIDEVSPTSVRSGSTTCGSVASAPPASCPPISSTPGSRSASCRRGIFFFKQKTAYELPK